MIKKIFSTFTFKFAAAIINLLIAVIVSQFLGASGKGEQSILLATISIILLFDNIVGGASVVYLVPRLKIKNVITVAYIWSTFITIISYFILHFTKLLSSDFNLIIAILSGLSSFVSINSSILVGKEEINKSNILNFIIPFVTIIVLAVLFFGNLCVNINAYLIAIFSAYISALIVSFFFLKPLISKQEKASFFGLKKSFKLLIIFGFQNQLAHVFQLLSTRISYYLLEYLWSKAEVGIYSNAVSISESIWMISSSICLFQYARISNSNDKKYNINLTETLTKYGMLISFIVILVIAFIPSNLYVFIFGSEFGNINKIIWLLAPGIWLFNYALIIGHFFSGSGKYYINAIASGIGLLVNIILLYILVPKYHFYGAAISASISYICTSLVVLIFFKKAGGKFVLFPKFSEIKTLIKDAKKLIIK